MKILLVAPNHRRILSPGYMKTIQECIGHLPPLGLLSIAGYLLENTSHRVRVVDALTGDLTPHQVGEIVKEEKPDVVGIHAITLALLDVLDMVDAVRTADPSAGVLLGGPHVSVFPGESVGYAGVDFAVAGEGEEPVARLLDMLESGGDPGEIDGVMTPSTGPKTPFIHKDLDSLPPPARHLTSFEKYHTVVSSHPPSTTIMSSRGCPFCCTFCHTAGGKVFRPRSPEKVVKEVNQCLDMGIREFFFFDETFTVHRDRVIDICRRLIDGGREVIWDARCRVDLVDEELLGWMVRAGCRRIQYGVESGSAKVLDRLGKGFDPDTAENAIMATRKAGIAAYADFMIGNPGETLEDMEETFLFARRTRPDYVHFSITMPLPGTPLYQEAMDMGIISGDSWRGFARNPSPDFRVPYWEENFTGEELEKLLGRAYREFYFSPGYLISALGGLTSPGEALRKARAGFRLLTGL